MVCIECQASKAYVRDHPVGWLERFDEWCHRRHRLFRLPGVWRLQWFICNQAASRSLALED